MNGSTVELQRGVPWFNPGWTSTAWQFDAGTRDASTKFCTLGTPYFSYPAGGVRSVPYRVSVLARSFSYENPWPRPWMSGPSAGNRSVIFLFLSKRYLPNGSIFNEGLIIGHSAFTFGSLLPSLVLKWGNGSWFKGIAIIRLGCLRSGHLKPPSGCLRQINWFSFFVCDSNFGFGGWL